VGVSVFNPYPVYGASDSWPRGFPLRFVKPTLKNLNEECIGTTRYCSAVVQQMLANHDPDVDAIYRLTNEKGVPFNFLAPKGAEITVPTVAQSAPSIALPPHTFTPWNAQATIITPGVYFAMLLPATVHGRVADIWRSYIIETLLTYFTVNNEDWSLSLKSSSKSDSADPCIVFTAPHIYHDRNSHNYQQDFNSELPLYMQAEALVSWLSVRVFGGERDLLQSLHSAFPSTSSTTEASLVLYDLMMLLYVQLYETGVIEHSDIGYVSAWISDVRRILGQKKALNSMGSSFKDPACIPKF